LTKEEKLTDLLTPDETIRVVKLKQEMLEAPNKKEVDGISSEIYAIYEEAKKRYYRGN